MAEDFRLKVGYIDHRKTKKLRLRCGSEGVDCHIRLISETAQNNTDGVLYGMDREDVEVTAGWTGAPGIFTQALIDIKFLDILEDGNFKMHDWEENQPWVCHEEQRKAKARKAANAKWGNSPHSDATSNAKTAKTYARSNAKTPKVDAPSPTPSPSPTPLVRENPPPIVSFNEFFADVKNTAGLTALKQDKTSIYSAEFIDERFKALKARIQADPAWGQKKFVAFSGDWTRCLLWWMETAMEQQKARKAYRQKTADDQFLEDYRKGRQEGQKGGDAQSINEILGNIASKMNGGEG